MAFPASPTNGQSATINGKIYTYNSTLTAWALASAAMTGAASYTTGSFSSTLGVTGLLTAAGGVASTTGSFSSTLGVTGLLTAAGGVASANGDFAIVNTTSSTTAWSNRTGVKNAAADKAVFVGTYNSVAIVGAHNNALNAWADLYINTTADTNAGITHIGSTQIVSLGVGTAASGTAGEIRATNAITAFYSDRRLKTEVGRIENALDKIDQLTGVLYTQNTLAESFGYNNYDTQVGLYAQDVQLAQPEAVKPAPFDIADDGSSKSGENYLTVQYEKLVPLLIEGIKELRLAVNELKGL